MHTMILPSVPMAIPNKDNSIDTMGMGPAQMDWHEGSPQSTPEVDVTYTENFAEGAVFPPRPDTINQIMWLTYKDGSESKFGFENYLAFEEGGLDVPNKQVLNWSKLEHIEPTLVCESYYNTSDLINTRCLFNGFTIVKGNASTFQLENGTSDDGWSFGPLTTLEYAKINYMDATTKIGEVILTTSDYIYNNQSLKESIAYFNVTINATIGTEIKYDLQVILKFTVTHNITATTYKYGVDIDWSTCLDFPISDTLNTGDDFSLLATDSVIITVIKEDFTTYPIAQFQTNPENDTAIFEIGGIVYAYAQFTKNYEIQGTIGTYNTTRIYVAEAALSLGGTKPSSQVFVIFDGFKYNQSSGLRFDPYVLIRSSIISDGGAIPWSGLLLTVLGLLAVISVFFWCKRINQYPIQ